MLDHFLTATAAAVSHFWGSDFAMVLLKVPWWLLRGQPVRL